MNKKIYLPILILFTVVIAQAQSHDGRVMIDTTIRSAVFFESDLSADAAGNAIESYFDSIHIEKEKGKGFIIKKSMGYLLFRRAKVDYINDAFDFYFVVDSKKQKGPDASTVYIAAAKNNNFISPENDKQTWNDLSTFANYMQSNYFEQYKVNTSLADLSKDLDKQKKKLDDILKQKSQLESNIASDSTQIANLHDQLLKLKAKKQ